MRKARLADVELARDADLGKNDRRLHAVSHLGHILRAGDTVLGFDVTSANLPEGEASSLRASLPDVVLVRKVYPRYRDDADEGTAPRHWKLAELEADGTGANAAGSSSRDEAAAENDYERFLQQLESDRDMRRQVNLYKSGAAPALGDDTMNEEGPDEEEIQLDELLDGLTLNDPNAKPDEREDPGGGLGIFTAETAPAPNVAALPDLDDPDL